MAGRAGLVADVAALDFVGYESGRWRTFGRAFKLDRATVAATVAALEEWVGLRPRRAARGLRRAGAGAGRALRRAGGARCRCSSSRSTSGWSTGRVNAVLVPRGAPARWWPRWPRGDPSVRAMVDGDALVLCTEALTAAEVDEIAAALSAVWQRLDDG